MIKLQDLYNPTGKKYDDGKGKNGMEGVFKWHNETLIAWTNGSDSIPDWLSNIKAWTYWFGAFQGWHYGFAKVPRKFYKSDKSNELIEALKKAKKIVWLAHSQGCPFRNNFLKCCNGFLKYKDIELYSFGSPNFAYKKQVDKFLKSYPKLKTQSFVNPGDLVPYVPARLSGFKKTILKDRKRNPVDAHLKYKDDVRYLDIDVLL